MKVDGDYYTGFETLKECEIKLLTDKVRKDTHNWYGDKLEALHEWARGLEKGSTMTGNEISKAVFGCLVNGSPTTGSHVNYAAQLNSVKYQLEKARLRIMELESNEKDQRPAGQGE